MWVVDKADHRIFLHMKNEIAKPYIVHDATFEEPISYVSENEREVGNDLIIG
jgi:hypothetical protein